MLKELECIYCGTKFQVETCANFTVICPCCNRNVYYECEYGYGPVIPCRIYLGEELAGIMDAQKNNYYVMMHSEKIPLAQTYFNAIAEAEETVKKRRHIFRPVEKLHPLPPGGSLCFYGDWFGRPHDNYHKIVSAGYDGEILEIIFKRSARLLLYNPENIKNTEKAITIEKASKIKWIYIPYCAKRMQYSTVIYTVENGNLTKKTDSGIEHFTMKEPYFALHLS